jgi:cytochrome c peroxidase
VYGSDVFADTERAFAGIVGAIAAYESSAQLHPFASKFDAFLRGQVELGELEQRGFALFKDPQKGNCIACHAGKVDSRDPRDWLFTDFTYDAAGVPRNRQIPDNADSARFDLGLCEHEGLATQAPRGFDVQSLCGAFRVPTLRNIALTAPYMHNGYFSELRDAVRFYATRDTNPEQWYPRRANGTVDKFDDLPERYKENVNVLEVPYDRHPGQAPRLDEHDIDALVAFLLTLTDAPGPAGL